MTKIHRQLVLTLFSTAVLTSLLTSSYAIAPPSDMNITPFSINTNNQFGIYDEVGKKIYIYNTVTGECILKKQIEQLGDPMIDIKEETPKK